MNVYERMNAAHSVDGYYAPPTARPISHKTVSDAFQSARSSAISDLRRRIELIEQLSCEDFLVGRRAFPADRYIAQQRKTMNLKDFGARIEKGALVLNEVNGHPEVTFRAWSDCPVPYAATIQRDGKTMTVDEVRAQLHLNGPVAYWLKNYTVVNVEAVMSKVNGPAYLEELDYAAQCARQTSILPIDVGFDLRARDTVCELRPEVTEVTYDKAGKIATVIGGHAEIEEALYAAGYKIQWQEIAKPSFETTALEKATARTPSDAPAPQCGFGLMASCSELQTHQGHS